MTEPRVLPLPPKWRWCRGCLAWEDRYSDRDDYPHHDMDGDPNLARFPGTPDELADWARWTRAVLPATPE